MRVERRCLQPPWEDSVQYEVGHHLHHHNRLYEVSGEADGYKDGFFGVIHPNGHCLDVSLPPAARCDAFASYLSAACADFR